MYNGNKILIICSIIFVALIGLAIVFSNEIALAANFVIIGIIILFVPYSVFRFFEFKKLRAYEMEFPNFLRDLAESQRAGMTIVQAIQAAAKTDYGALTKEVQKMKNKLSWNIPLSDVLNDFAESTGKSKLIVRSLLVIEQANKSGGNVEDTMDSLANNIEMIKEVNEEKATLLEQQVIMMYAIFFIFLGISLALIKFLIPMLQMQTQTGAASLGGLGNFNSNPCYPCIDASSPSCFGCDIFFTISAGLDFGTKQDPAAYYKALFFAMIIIQGFFSGLIAGQIGSDSVIAGVKHSFIMVFSGFLIYVGVLRLGII